MEEADDEIHSQPPPSPPGEGGRIAVTVASTPPLSPPLQLPQPSPPTSQPTTTTHKAGGGGGGCREDCWSEGATGVLIDAWGERYLELSRGNLKQKHWKEVAEIVSSRDNHSKTLKTDIQCKNRIDTVKKKYKLEKGRIASGGTASKWVFFDKLDRLIGSTAKMSKIPIGIPVRVSINANLNASNHSFDRKSRTVQLQIHRKRPQPVAAGLETKGEEGKDATGSPESADSLPRLPPPPPPVKKRRTAVEAEVREEKEARERGKWRRRGRRRRRGDGVRELTQAILRFGEMYEKVERAKLMQMVAMEKQRMKFVKELELQRTQFFVKTQQELSQMKVKGTRRRRRKRKRGGNSNGNQFHSCNDEVDNDNNDVNDNNSDSSN